jgi:hypothetical protein
MEDNDNTENVNIDKREETLDTLKNAGLAGAAAEVIQRYGSANKEHLVAYSGIDNETGNTLKKSLNSISKSKVNSDYKDTNIKQQAGFSAEVKETAKENAERIINREKTRVIRTDDVGRVNDPLYDHVEIDEQGNVIEGSGSQMKFVGSDPESALSKLASKKFEKYIDADAKIEVPSNYYDKMKVAIQNKIESLKKQVEYLNGQPGKENEVKKILAEIEKYQKIDKNLVKSHVSTQEAQEARLHPKFSTAKDILKISHRAGVEQAKWGAVIGGVISLIKNLVSVVKGDKEPQNAALDVVKDTGSGALISYTTAFSGSALKGIMQNSASKSIQGISKTNFPAIIATSSLEAGKILYRYIKGEIDGAQCLEELGEKSTSMLASAMFATIGQIAIPIPVVGGLIGGMLGYALSSACYSQVLGALKEEKLAREERIQIKAECQEAIIMIREYRAEMQKLVSDYLVEHITVFRQGFDKIKEALNLDDIDGYIAAANMITRKLGREPQFENFNEFDSFMYGEEPLKL